MTLRRPLSRRTFLRGTVAGTSVALGLPLLDAMLGREELAAEVLGAPPFFGVFYWANGVPWHGGHGAAQAGPPDIWTPTTTGAGYDLTEMLTPLAGRGVSVISGLEPYTEIPTVPGGQSDGHMRGFMVALTGDSPQSEGFDHGSHTLTSRRGSIDQFVARYPGFYPEEPRFRSLEVGVSRARFHDYWHWNAISYNGTDSQNLPVQDAGALYDRLFGVPVDDQEALRRGRLLDAVLEDARSLDSRLGARDRERLEAHLDHLRTLQLRVESSAPVCEAVGRPSDSGDLIERTRTMASLLSLSVSCGLTRVFSFMLTSPASTHVFSNLGVPDGMHKTCHDGHWERVRDITRYQMEAFAAFLDGFDVPAPDGSTLLDRGVIYATSEYGEGWQHSVKELPVLLAGGGCGRLQRGVHVREAGGNLAKAQLAALWAAGVETPSFGWNGAETSEPVSGILV
jgi:hypothetical protein